MPSSWASTSRRYWTTGADEALLDEYAATAPRRPLAASCTMTSRLTELATASSRRRPIRNRVMRMAGQLPAVRRALAWRLSGLNRR